MLITWNVATRDYCALEIAELNIPITFVNESVDGSPNIHNKVRGVDSYHRAIETLRRLRELDYQFQNRHRSFWQSNFMSL